MMKRVFRAVLVVCVMAAAMACDDDSPTSPSEVVVYTATLLPANENPPVTNAQNTGSGTATIQMVITRDSSNVITSALVHFSVSLTGFPTDTRINLSHIHRGISTANGPVVVDTGLVANEIPVLATGGVNYVKVDRIATPAIAQEILGNHTGFYFNVHSNLSPGGVARGQLVKQ